MGQTPQRDIVRKLQNLEPFDGSSMKAFRGGSRYFVISFHEMIAMHTEGGGWFLNTGHYGKTTQKHQNWVRKAAEGQPIVTMTSEAFKEL